MEPERAMRVVFKDVNPTPGEEAEVPIGKVVDRAAAMKKQKRRHDNGISHRGVVGDEDERVTFRQDVLKTMDCANLASASESHHP